MLGLYFLFVNLEVFGHETYMDYRVSYLDSYTMSNDELTRKDELYYSLESMDNLCKIYPIYISNLDVEIDKKALSRQYIKYLQQSAEERIALSNGNLETAQMRVYKP